MKRNLLSQETIQLTGFLLWRFGILLAGATAIYRTVKFLLKLIDLPLQLETGIGLIIAGAVFFLASVLMEQVSDGRREKS